MVSDVSDPDGLFHEPVMVSEVLRLLNPGARDGLYFDGTVGGGGHARELLRCCPSCRLVAVDRDPEALAASRLALREFEERVRYVEATFDEAIAEADIAEGTLAGALLDLGVSSRQLESDRRGFSFRRGAPLDMRMGGGGSGVLSAADLLNGETEQRLAYVFREYGEEPRARLLAREVARRRTRVPFETSDDLMAALTAVLGRSARPSEKARVFQALRIAVNDELGCLERALPAIRRALEAGGVLVVISYHSLEDRTVKHALRDWSGSCTCPPGIPVCRCGARSLGTVLTRRPLRSSREEETRNPRARSARLRAWRNAA